MSSALPSQDVALGSSQTSFGANERKAHQSQPRVRRRNRLITSCLECRRRKLKCDKGHPCTHCTKNSRQCVFIAPGLDADAQAKLAEVKEQMGLLERSLEEGVARKTESNARSPIDFSRLSVLPGQDQDQPSDQEDDEETKNLRPTYLVTEDAAYYEPEEDTNDDMVDLGFRMGKVRITERIGGLVRPRFSDELAETLSDLPRHESSSQPRIEEDPASWLAPTEDYIAPSSNFMLVGGVGNAPLESYLPSRFVVDKLIAHYWFAVHVVSRAVHRPSFERQYQNFWIRVNMGMEPRSSFQAVLFAALLNSVVSMTEDKVRAEFCVERKIMISNFRAGTETALAKANFLRTTKLETIQAFVMYLIPLCRYEVSRAHSALTGSLIRLAECMGLHRDPVAYSSSPIEIQVRRMLWYQICFLDLRTCEAVGPRPQIRLDDYDTRFPLNIDDDDLDRAERGEPGVNVTKDANRFTDMTISRMRFEAYEMHRFLWSERPKLDRKLTSGKREVTITTILSRVQSFQAAMEKKYVPMLSKLEPLHVLASELYGIVSNRLYVSVLQKYITGARSKMPESLRNLVMSASTMILEHGMAIEQHHVLSNWAWIVGALHQHHCAILLINEIYIANPEPAMEQRIWRCLDYSFNIPPGLSNVEKTRKVLEELVGKTKRYCDMRRVRIPTSMPPVPQEHRQRVQREESGHQESMPSPVSSTGPLSHILSGKAVAHQFAPPQPQPQAYSPCNGPPLAPMVNSFPGAMPSVDWGTIDFTAAMPASQPPLYSDFLPSTPGSKGHVTRTMPNGGGDASSPSSAIYGMAPGSTGSNSMDAINDIDWNDVEKMFGSAEVGAGNMIIPPFTFPQFSAEELRWPEQDVGMQ
ncbi:fungal specific transcription factor domain containing protein [Stemphylium lycopersici]|uniref:Fungal specific transcription factor domain containing protein n=1 Tax=Stemphylium lycopersici TaxID=183478 RepID=A0A364N635_STELY|nr:fungal specific transcription factor domain containing protein [Stemphylium lycopersici]RAR12808.1 fungal specific transcription factor domain containing protein [Stemphylium lycopersici]